MLSRWFKNGSDKSPPASPEAATDSAPAAGTPAEPARQAWLDAITGGQPIDAVTDPDILHQLVKHSDRLDKRSNRIVREKLAALKDEQKRAQQAHEQQVHLCERLETLARLQHHPLFGSEVAHLQQQWQACPDPDPALAARVGAALQTCQATLEQAREETEAAERAAAARQAAEAERARAAEAERAAADEQAQARETARQAAQDSARASSAAQQQQQAALVAQATQQLDQLETALAAADVKKARQALDRARDTLGKLPPRQAHAFEGRLHLLQGQWRELQDWQAFAARPKLEELCTAMEALVSTDLPPLEKAEAVRDLQEKWRQIKMPGGKQSRALWERFHKAGETAWEPCSAHFEQEKQQRAFRLAQREAICDALEQFQQGQDWDKADWKAVARILEKARQEFHQYHPVERGQEKPIRRRFDQALAPIQARLLAEQQRNEERKQQLVHSASALAAMADAGQAAERIRQLQAQWKDIGVTRRHVDQALWQTFQSHCQAVFARKQEARDASRQEEQARIQEARQLCDAISALAKLDDAELAASQPEFERLQTAFRAIQGLPEKLLPGLRKSFHQACDRYRDQMAGMGSRQRALQWQQLAERAALCSQLESQPDPALAASLATEWDATCARRSLPADWHKAISARWDQARAVADGAPPPDYEANELARRELCIELEILLDQPTPEADRPLRHALQMRKLQQGLGQTAGPRQERLDALKLQWYTHGPAAPAAQALLQARFADLAHAAR